jgi:hypothetical protein
VVDPFEWIHSEALINERRRGKIAAPIHNDEHRYNGEVI